MKIKEELKKLNTPEIYSLILFSLYKLNNDPQYSTLSELPYLLDRQSLLNLLQYYGGLTIKIPTIRELEILVYALSLHEKVCFDGKSFSEALSALGHDKNEEQNIVEAYQHIQTVLEGYSFGNED